MSWTRFSNEQNPFRRQGNEETGEIVPSGFRQENSRLACFLIALLEGCLQELIEQNLAWRRKENPAACTGSGQILF